MRMIRTAVVLAFIPIMLAAGGDEMYQVKFDRPLKAGDKYALISQGVMSIVSSMTDQDKTSELNRMEASADYAATVTVISVGANGDPTKSTHLVTRCTAILPQGSSEFLPAGTEMTVEVVGDHREFSVGGTPLGQEAEQFITLVITKSYTPESDDTMFGTSERKKVGDTWPVNAAAMAKSLSEKEADISADDIIGAVTLEDVRERWGQPCLYVTSTLDVGKTPAPPLPEGFTLVSSKVKLEFTGLLPVDVTNVNSDSTASMRAVAKAKGRQSPDSPEVTLTMTMTRSHKEVLELVK